MDRRIAETNNYWFLFVFFMFQFGGAESSDCISIRHSGRTGVSFKFILGLFENDPSGLGIEPRDARNTKFRINV